MEQPKTNHVLKPLHEGEPLKIAEAVLKRRHYDVKEKVLWAKKRAEQRKNASLKGKLNLGIITPEKLLKRKRVQILDAKRIHRLKFIPDSPRVKSAEMSPVLFVVRNARFHVSRTSFAILKNLGLTHPYRACFLPNTTESLRQLRVIKIFVFYGFLDTDTLYNLLYKKLHFQRKKEVEETDQQLSNCPRESILVCDNSIVEDYLGYLGILCIEDIVDEIKSRGPNFDAITKIMWYVVPFNHPSIYSF